MITVSASVTPPYRGGNRASRVPPSIVSGSLAEHSTCRTRRPRALFAGRIGADFRTAAEQVNLAVGHDGDEYQGSAEQDSGFDFMTRDEVAGAEHESSLLKGVLRLAFVRCPLMGFGIVGGGYALALLGGARPGCCGVCRVRDCIGFGTGFRVS